MTRIIVTSVVILGFVLVSAVFGAPQKYTSPSKSLQRYQKPTITKYQKQTVPKYQKPR